jgi:hypothetical protein
MLIQRLRKLFRRQIPDAPLTDMQQMKVALKPDQERPIPKRVTKTKGAPRRL